MSEEQAEALPVVARPSDTIVAPPNNPTTTAPSSPVPAAPTTETVVATTTTTKTTVAAATETTVFSGTVLPSTVRHINNNTSNTTIKLKSVDGILTREAQSFLGRRDTYPRRAKAYAPTLKELQSKSFSDYVRGILFEPIHHSHNNNMDDEAQQQHQTKDVASSSCSHHYTRSSPNRNINARKRQWSDGVAKITLPKGWWDQAGIAKDPTARGEQWQKGTKLGDMMVQGPIKQCVRGIGGVYEYTLLELPPLTLADFRQQADAYRVRQLGSAISGDWSDDEACEMLARKFWKRVGPTMEPSVYGADMEGSLFDGAHACGWNLESLESCLQLLSANTNGRKLPGVTTPYLYIGMYASVFCAHTEDMNLLSINYLHAGAPKFWYAIAPQHAKRFESLAQSHFAHAFRECPEFLRHKRYLLSPAVLKKAGVPFTTQIQRPGDAIVTLPGSYHFGINLGFNVAEATNFAVPEWIPKGIEAKICLCRPHSVHIDMEQFQALLQKYDDDMRGAVKVGYPKLSYNEWTVLEANRKKRKDRPAAAEMLDGISKFDPLDPKHQTEFVIEVTPPISREQKRKKKRQKRSKDVVEEDWRLALPISDPRSLTLKKKVLCVFPGKDENGVVMDEELCFAGEVVETADDCVKVHFDGMQRKDDQWVAVDSAKMFLDGGRQYYN